MLEVKYLKDSRTRVRGEIHSIVVPKNVKTKPFYFWKWNVKSRDVDSGK